MENKSFFTSYADWTGIAAASICLLHCLAGPFILGISAHAHEHVAESDLPWYLHESWDYLFLVIGFLAVRYSARHSHHRWMRLVLWGSYGSLAAALLLEHQAPFFQNVVYVSSIVLICAHVFQIRKNLLRSKGKNEKLESVKVH